jgi:hypothetical protein
LMLWCPAATTVTGDLVRVAASAVSSFISRILPKGCDSGPGPEGRPTS